MTTKARLWSFGTLASIALGAAVTMGCTQSTVATGPNDPSPGTTPQAVQAAQATQAQSEAASAHEMHGPPGPEMVLLAALHHLDLTPSQRTTIENAAHSVPPRMPMDRSLFADVAAGVRAGKLDEASVLAKLEPAGPAPERTASLASAIDTLHATLTPDQRRELVDTITKHIDDHKASAVGSGTEGPLGHLLAGINLTTDQRASIDRILAAQKPAEDREAMAAHIEAFHADLRVRLQRFATDPFDAAAFVAPSKDAPPMSMKDHVQCTLHALGAILPVLDSAQRESLAATIEKGPPGAH